MDALVDATSFHQWVRCIQPQTKTWLGGHDLDARRLIYDAIKNRIVLCSGPIDLCIITPETVDEAVYFSEKVVGRLLHDSFVWIARHEALTEDSPSPGSDDLVARLHRAGFEPIAQGVPVDTYRLVPFRSVRCE